MSRSAPAELGASIDVRQPRFREFLGDVFTWLVRRLIADVSDATCGFKAYRSEVAKDLVGRQRLYDWSFDAELLFLARHLGYRIGEVPVRWADRAGTKVRLIRDVQQSLAGLIRIRLNAAQGVYERSEAVEPYDLWQSHPGARGGVAGPYP